MLETPQERVKLLRKGFTQKQIEKMYIEGNNFKIVNPPVTIHLVEINHRQNKKMCVNCIEAVEYAQSLCSEMVNLHDITKFYENFCKNTARHITT
jgi:hypothetical protein